MIIILDIIKKVVVKIITIMLKVTKRMILVIIIIPRLESGVH